MSKKQEGNQPTSPPPVTIHVPNELVPVFDAEAARLGVKPRQLYRAGLKKFSEQFPLKEKLVLA